MANYFTTLPTEKQEMLKRSLNGIASQELYAYVRSKHYILDCIANTRDEKAVKLVRKKIYAIGKQFSQGLTYEDGTSCDEETQKKYYNQFKYFVKTYTRLTNGRYNWHAIEKNAEEA